MIIFKSYKNIMEQQVNLPSKKQSSENQLETLHHDINENIFVEKHHSDQPSTDKLDWTLDGVNELRDYAYQSAGYSWMYATDAGFWFNCNVYFSITIGLLSTLSIGGIGAAITLIAQNGSISWLFYVFSSFSIFFNMVILMLTAVKGIMNFDYRINQCLDKSAKFSKLYRKIKGQFVTPPNQRLKQKDMLDLVYDRFDELNREKPFLRGKTRAEWEKHLSAMTENPTNLNCIINMPSEFKTRDLKPIDRDIRDNKIAKYIQAML